MKEKSYVVELLEEKEDSNTYKLEKAMKTQEWTIGTGTGNGVDAGTVGQKTGWIGKGTTDC